MEPRARKEVITDRFIQSLCSRLSQGRRVRRRLPVWGRVHIDRQLPFLCVYRKPPNRDDTGTEKLLFGEAAYVTASGSSHLHGDLSSMVKSIVETQTEAFDHVMIIEIWSSDDDSTREAEYSSLTNPVFRIHAPASVSKQAIVDRLRLSLKSIQIHKQQAEVSIVHTDRITPVGLPPLLRSADTRRLGVTVLGLEIRPVYRGLEPGVTYPLILRSLHRSLSVSFKRTFFEFSKEHTKHKAPHFLSLGRRAVVKAVWEVDNKLADVSNSFSLLLTVTPTNSHAAYLAFRRSRYEKAPEFTYHPIPVDTALLKRTLQNIPIERIEDPVLAHIFREQQDDLDRRLTLLSDRNTRRFLYGSMQLFGGVQNWILEIAGDLLSTYQPRSRDESKSGYVTAEEFAAYANEEIEYYREKYEKFSASCRITHDVAGLIVSKGRLLIGARSKIPRLRVKALVQHEIGTHLLTYFNGKAQPFRQLYVGLAGYDELQEGLAVLSEYLVDGLTGTRMRLLAARVVAVRRLIEGATFVDTFRELNSVYGLERRSAFTITMRVFRGGGLTKDATYLKGLLRMMEYFVDGGDLETLLLGKFNSDHVPLINELKYRQVLKPPQLLPRYLDESDAQERLARLRKKLTLFDLVRSDVSRRIVK